MLLGGKGGCQQCTCVPCDECTRTCQNPYTGTAFEAVYTRYFEGVEAGNPSDGYLSATGNSDTSDPYDGMDGTGPWFQQITGGFTLNSTQTRFPCRVTISFWRNQYGVGVQSIPPPSTALTFEGVFVEVSSGAVIVGDRVIVPADGEVQITGVSIPLVSGGGDQSSNDPRRYEGGISIAPQCESASFSIRATINWNTQRRQHILYGLVRECYEEESPCAAECSGSGVPDVLYVTISNYTGPTPDGTTLNATYVLERVPNNCYWWDGLTTDDCLETPSTLRWNSLYSNALRVSNGRLFSGVCYGVGLDVFTQASWDLCLTGVIATGTNGTTKIATFGSGTSIPMTGSPFTNSFDWKIET
jgi:hypothetical protein